jgi:acyloxyacyl hydrolase
MHTLRGADWRGKDCDDADINVRPGRKPMDADINVDSNCNGIYGVDPETNKPYEELFCQDTPQYGTVVLGDSASAHFHVQPQVNKHVFARVTMILCPLHLVVGLLSW